MTTVTEDNVFGRDFLERIIEWVAKNLEPEEVFGEKKLEDWAWKNSFIHIDEAENYMLGKHK